MRKRTSPPGGRSSGSATDRHAMVADNWSVRLLTAPSVRAKLHRGLALLEMCEGDFDAARANAEEALRLCRKLGEPRVILGALEGLAAVAKASRDTTEAIALYEEICARARDLGNREYEAGALGELAQLTEADGDYARAATLAQEALDLAEESGDRFTAVVAQLELAFHELREGTSGKARLRDALLAARDRRWPAQCAAALVGLATSSSRVDPAKAARLVGAADAQMQEIGVERDHYDETRRQRVMATLQARLEAEELDRLLDDGRAMTLDQAVECALGAAGTSDADSDKP